MNARALPLLCVSLTLPLAAQTAWSDAGSFPQPLAGACFVYQEATGRCLMFGGSPGPAMSLDETREWDGAGWIRWQTATGPGPRSRSAAAYDSDRRVVVLFGGVDDRTNAALSDTWEWDGETWTERFPTAAPPPRHSAAMTADPFHGGVLMFGGNDLGTALADTWIWNGADWSLAATVGVSARYGHTMITDHQGGIFLFGGVDNFSNYYNDLHYWNGVAWTPARTSGMPPAPRANHGMAYDRALRRAVMFGGEDQGGPVVDLGFWYLDLGRAPPAWNHMSTSDDPEARTHHGFVFDRSRGRFVMFGGHTGVAFPPDVHELTRQEEWIRRTPTNQAVVDPSTPGALVAPAMAYRESSRHTVLFGGARNGVPVAETWLRIGVRWARITTRTVPAPRWRHAMTYDRDRDRVVMCGGYDSNGLELAELWEFDGVDWSLRFQGSTPAPRADTVLGYDPDRQRVVMFGGRNGAPPFASFFDDSWEWDGVQWHPSPFAGRPPARAGAALAWDATEARLVLVGGYTESLFRTSYLADTWVYRGGLWTGLGTAVAPPARTGHVLVGDPSTVGLVLYGGSDDGQTFDDTWLLRGTSWQLQPPLFPGVSPGPRTRGAAALDGARGRVLLVGGHSGGVGIGDCWEHDGATWRPMAGGQPALQLRAEGPMVRSRHAMAYDSDRSAVVLFGGEFLGGLPGNDTWVWEGERWTGRNAPHRPPPRVQHALAHDRSRGVTVLFGGTENGATPQPDTWEWNGADWTRRMQPTPPPRWGHAMAFDETRAVTVLFGGTDGSSVLADTWTWNGGVWQIRGTAGPGAREQHAMAYDSARRRVVLFGGRAPGGGLLDDTWEWDGIGWQLRTLSGSTSVSPPPRQGHTMAFDAGRGVMVLHGGQLADGTILGDAWEYNGQSWQFRIPPTAKPTDRVEAAMAYDLHRGRSVLFGGRAPVVPPLTVALPLADPWSWVAPAERGPGDGLPISIASRLLPMEGGALEVVFPSELGVAALFVGMYPRWTPITVLQGPPFCGPIPFFTDPIGNLTVIGNPAVVRIRLPTGLGLAGVGLSMQALALGIGPGNATCVFGSEVLHAPIRMP